MRAHAGICGEHVKRSKNMVGGVVENFCRRTVQWNVKMDAPLRGSVVFWLAKERFIKIAIDTSLPIRPADNDLMQIDVLGKSSERRAGFRRGPNFERGA